MKISNHAAARQESRHNLTYWRYGDYLGIGPGAHGRFEDGAGNRWATRNTTNPEAWREASGQDRGAAEKEKIDKQTARTEALLMGLRLAEGLRRAKWQDLFGEDIEAELNKEKVDQLCRQGFLESTAEKLCATIAGRQRLERILREIYA
jgi:oxygen-independent coproporphyrinogen-3 oxidase